MRIVSGLDVHKDSIYLCILSSTGEIIEKKYGVLTYQLEEDCFFSRFSYHQTQVRKKSKMKVVVAISRKMIVCAWHILTEKVAYKDFDNTILAPDTKG